MALPPTGTNDDDASGGESYGAVILAADDPAVAGISDILRGIRFSGWIAPPIDGWVVILGDPGDGVVADARRGVLEVGAMVAERTDSAVLAVRVRQDRQLAVVVWSGGGERGRYCSDPSREPTFKDEKDIVEEPVGVEIAEVLADVWNRPDAEDDLIELLEEELDPESVFESERLSTLLRMLGLPTWIVAAGALPKDIPTGPRARELTRLHAGSTSAAGVVLQRTLRPVRRRQHPPPVIADPPRGAAGYDEWML